MAAGAGVEPAWSASKANILAEGPASKLVLPAGLEPALPE